MYGFIPFEFPKTLDGQYVCCLDNAGILRSRREQLGLTQQQVAQMAHIQFSQYQRLEAGERDISGCCMRTGLAICAVLLLDPYKMTGVSVAQPDVNTMKSHPPVDFDIPDFPRKRVGRKQIRRDIMTVFINSDGFFLVVPYDVLSKLGELEYVQIRWSISEKRIVLCKSSKDDKSALDIPEELYEMSLLAIPKPLTKNNPIAAMNWGKEPYAVESRLVLDSDGEKAILIDLNTAKLLKEPINGVFITPKCLIDH